MIMIVSMMNEYHQRTHTISDPYIFSRLINKQRILSAVNIPFSYLKYNVFPSPGMIVRAVILPQSVAATAETGHFFREVLLEAFVVGLRPVGA